VSVTRMEQPVIAKYLCRELQSIFFKACAIHSLINTRRSQA